eukprot:CAMPEP_0119429810 /NCGR_PEP_ID=MMETSP1335-20130426/42896_1 /TAXON_ID=259385 /ORGANISM="Chrysoculter rhomboideus, Strain RCC1486" /LENGTH=120 /DNA_ID=CAMNT_0007455545 /DNA_START=11 /DNA_END=373 /DNA_ORIENTATION=-
MEEAWLPLCTPTTRWGGDEQLSLAAQSTLLFQAVVYQRAHNRLQTLTAIDDAVAKCISLLAQGPQAELVRTSLAERVRQVITLAMDHQAGQPKAATAHAQQAQHQRAATAEELPTMMLTT